MSKIQKIIIVIYCILVATACIYVPWKTNYTIKHYSSSDNKYSFDYSPFWKAPSLKVTLETKSYKTYDFSSYEETYITYRDELIIQNATIEFQKIILELIAITAVFGILFVLTLRPKQKEE